MRAWLFAAGFCVACGGDTTIAPDTGAPMDDAGIPDDAGDMDTGIDTGVPIPAPFPTPPQVVNSGGPTAGMGIVVPVFWSNDPYQTQAEQFLKAISPSTYWSATTKEYKVGDFTLGSSVVITDAAPASVDDTTDIQPWLAAHADGSDMAWPKADSNTVYVLFYPSGTSVTAGGQQGCNGFGGYHSEYHLADNTPFSYAVIPRCGGVDTLTGTTSHELVEWATDPFPFSNRAYAQVDTLHFYWGAAGGALGSETGDMCELQSTAYGRILGSFVVQRSWSNASIKAGHDPCVPPPAGVYFAAAPVLPDVVTYNFSGGKVKVKGVLIPVGTSKTIDLDLYSDGPMAPWTVSANASASANGALTFSFDTNKGQNGDVLHLTINAVKTTSTGNARFSVTSVNPQNVRHSWFGMVAFQ